jgi:hypothetical protein
MSLFVYYRLDRARPLTRGVRRPEGGVLVNHCLVSKLVISISLLIACTVDPARAGQRLHEDGSAEFQSGLLAVRTNGTLDPALVGYLAGVTGTDLRDPAERERLIERAEDVSRRLGFLDATGSLTAANQTTDATTGPRFVLLINEGKPYLIRRLEFGGNETVRDSVIRRMFLTNEGDPIDEQILKYSLERINQLGVFEEVTRDDVEITRVNGRHEVDLVVTFVERSIVKPR